MQMNYLVILRKLCDSFNSLCQDGNMKRPLASRVEFAFACFFFSVLTDSVDQVNAGMPTDASNAVNGVVTLKSDDSPVANADVYLLRSTGESFTLPTHPEKTTTDNNGHFTFEGVKPGNYRVWAETGNLVSHLRRLDGVRVSVESGKENSPLQLQLVEAARLKVVVTDKASNQPIPNAELRFRWADIPRVFKADENGVALIEGARIQKLVIEARADGYAVAVQDIAQPAAGATTDLKFSLGPGGRIRGRIVDEDGNPLKGAGVSGNVERSPAPLRLRYKKTEADGHFEFNNAPIGEEVEISASLKEYVRAIQRFVLPAGQSQVNVEVVLKRLPDEGSILVSVSDVEGNPVVGAKLKNPGTSSSMFRSGVTDKNGKCRIDRVLGIFGRRELSVRAKGFAPFVTNFKPGTKESPQTINVVLEPGHFIRGRVLLADDQPAKKVRVYYNEGEHGDLSGGRVTTDDEGRFEIDSLPKGCTFTIYSPKGYGPFADKPLQLDGDDEVVVRLEPAGIVKGTVVDADTGKPLVPYRVRIMISQDRTRDDPVTSMPTRLVEEGLVITDSSAAFQFGDYPNGCPMQLIFSAEGYEQKILTRLEARPAGEAKSTVVRLEKSDPRMYREVTGKLVDGNGKPAAAAQIRIWTSDLRQAEIDIDSFPFNWQMIQSGQLERTSQCREFFTATTDSNGQFRIPRVRKTATAEIAWWRRGMAAGRQFFSNDTFASPKIVAKAVAAATLVVEIDPAKWPTAAGISLCGQSLIYGYKRKAIEKGKTVYTFTDLPPAVYSLSVRTSGERFGGAIRNIQSLFREQVPLNAGEELNFKIPDSQ